LNGVAGFEGGGQHSKKKNCWLMPLAMTYFAVVAVEQPLLAAMGDHHFFLWSQFSKGIYGHCRWKTDFGGFCHGPYGYLFVVAVGGCSPVASHFFAFPCRAAPFGVS
jgi:hypothetical protein